MINFNNIYKNFFLNFFLISECTLGLSNGKIIIKDLKESRLYHELINEVEEKERLKTKKREEEEHGSTLQDLEKKKKKGLFYDYQLIIYNVVI